MKTRDIKKHLSAVSLVEVLVVLALVATTMVAATQVTVQALVKIKENETADFANGVLYKALEAAKSPQEISIINSDSTTELVGSYSLDLSEAKYAFIQQASSSKITESDCTADSPYAVTIPNSPASSNLSLTCLQAISKKINIGDSDFYYEIVATIVYKLSNHMVASSLTVYRRSESSNPIAAPVTVQKKVLFYDLQPAGTASNYENAFTSFASNMSQSGFDFSHGNRSAVPTIDLAYLQGFAAVQFWNGCGGSKGLFSSAEVEAIRQYYLGGGNLIIVADDSTGDSTSPGSCYDRVQTVANSLGVSYSGTYSTTTGCAEVLTKPSNTYPITDVFSHVVSPYSPSNMTIGTFIWSGNWGNSVPTMILAGPHSGYIAYIPASATHGSAIFVPSMTMLVNQCPSTGDLMNFWRNYVDGL